MADELHYVPMPANVVKDIQNMWAKEIKDANGKPLFVMGELTSRCETEKTPNGVFSNLLCSRPIPGLALRTGRPLELRSRE